jgi:hypothetical protein
MPISCGSGVPQRTRRIHIHHFDSRRWDHVALRDDDIVIASPYKSGTTWFLTVNERPLGPTSLLGWRPTTTISTPWR